MPCGEATPEFTSAVDIRTVTFDASDTVVGSSPIETYTWNFGDGNTSSGITTEHTYTDGGNYTVTLTVTDEDNRTNTATADVTVIGPDAFVTTWDTSLGDDPTVTLGLAGTVDAVVNWGDGNTTAVTSAGPLTHTYAEDGIYTVSVSGTLTGYNGFEGIPFNSFQQAKLVSVDQWGDTGLTSLLRAFTNATNLVGLPDDHAGTRNVTTMQGMFAGATSLETVPPFDTSSVENMDGMFSRATSLTGVPQFDTSNVRFMQSMFLEAESLETLPQFDTRNVENMAAMFQGATSFNADLSGWCVTNITAAPLNFAANTPAWDPYLPPVWGTCFGDADPSFTSDVDGLDVTFDATGTVAGSSPIDSYSWDFGDGNVATGMTVSHTYADEGDYTVTLTVSDELTRTNSVTGDVTVEAPPEPPVVPDPTPEPTEPEPDPVDPDPTEPTEPETPESPEAGSDPAGPFENTMMTCSNFTAGQSASCNVTGLQVGQQLSVTAVMNPTLLDTTVFGQPNGTASFTFDVPADAPAASTIIVTLTDVATGETFWSQYSVAADERFVRAPADETERRDTTSTSTPRHTTTGTTGTTGSGDGELAMTGSPVVPLAVFALLFIALGTLMLRQESQPKKVSERG